MFCKVAAFTLTYSKPIEIQTEWFSARWGLYYGLVLCGQWQIESISHYSYIYTIFIRTHIFNIDIKKLYTFDKFKIEV